MKKRNRGLVLALSLLLGMTVLVAEPYMNKQMIYSLDSDVYEAIAVLYMDQGLSLPSTTGPYSQAELQLMLEKLNSARFGETAKATYDYICGQLDIQPKIPAKGVGFSWNVGANVETYLHTNTTDFTTRDAWIRGYNQQKPLLSIGLETWPGKNFYGYSEFTVANNNHLQNVFGSSVFGTNVLMVPPNVLGDLDMNMPYRAFVAAGGDYWSFQLGRDRMNWGAGVSGNMMLGDNIKYHNMARFTAFGSKFKYTFVTSFFPHPKEYMDYTTHDATTAKGNQRNLLDGISMYMAHRLEWRMFKDKVGFALTESIMYQSEENYLDLRILNPAAIFHDYYIRSNANSLLGFELDYTPINNLNVYGQVVVDEFALPGETIPSTSDSGFPLAFGYLGGVKYTKPLPKDNLVLKASFEAAYTDPYLYLRYSKSGGDGVTATDLKGDTYGLDYVVAVREYNGNDKVYYNAAFLGYTYGCDAIAFNLNGGVKQYGKWNAEANVFYMIHGTHDMYTAWTQTGGTTGDNEFHSPTTSHPTANAADSTAQTTRNSAYHLLVAGVHGSYEINTHFSVYGQVDYIHIKNYKNVSGKNTNDVQLTLGVSYSM